MALAPTLAVAGAVYLVRVIVQRLAMAMRQSFVMGAADPGERASVASLGRIPGQAASAVVPPATGYLLDEVSLAVPFVIAAAFQVGYAVVFHAFFHRLALPEETAAEPTHGAVPEASPDDAPGAGPPARPSPNPRP